MLAESDANWAAPGRLIGDDANVVSMVERRLQTAPYTELRRVSCSLTEGVLTLKGSVPRYYLKQHAYQVVADIANDHRVKNEIVVSRR